MDEVKVILQLYPVLPASGAAEREALAPIGRNAERYSETVHGMTEVVRAAETLGLWGVGTIEHHFWSEGYEARIRGCSTPIGPPTRTASASASSVMSCRPRTPSAWPRK